MITAKKNTAYYLVFPAIDSTTPASYKSGISPVDAAYSKDGAGVWTSLAITDTATEIGATGVYEMDLTAAEMNHDQVLIKFAVSGMADDAYQFDLSDKLTDDLNDVAATDVVSAGAITTSAGAVVTVTTNSDMVAEAPTAAAVVDEWETQSQADPTGFHVNLLEIGGTGQTANDNGADINTLISRVTAAVSTAAAMALAQADLDTLTGTDGATLATAQGNYAPAKAADVNTEVVDVLKTDTIADLSNGAPPATPTFQEAIMYLYSALRNRTDVDPSGTPDYLEYYNDAGALVWRKVISDDSSTYTEAKGIAGS